MATANWQPTKAEFWKYLPAPARPWPSEVAWFEKYALKKKAKSQLDVLILGSTVEFRSMLHQHGLNVHVVDFSKKFYDILSEQPMQFRGPETYFEQDWRTMELGKKFDLIFGDWVPGVLPTGDYDQFYKHTISLLKNDGLFVARECLRPDRSEVDLEAVVRRHNAQWASQYSFYETSMQYVYAYCPDPATAMCDITASKKALAEVGERGIMHKDDYEFFVKALAVEKSPLSVKVQEDFENELKKYFEIVVKHYGAEPSAPWYPIYVLRKKQ